VHASSIQEYGRCHAGLGSKRACEFNTEMWTLSCWFWAASVHLNAAQKKRGSSAGLGQ